MNVKDIKIVDNEESGLVKRVKADFKKLGPRYGKIMKDLGKAIIAMSQKEIAVLEYIQVKRSVNILNYYGNSQEIMQNIARL